MGYSPLLCKSKAGTRGRNLEAGLEQKPENDVCCLPPPGLLSYLYYTVQVQFLRDNTAHSRMCPHASISN